MRFLTRFLPGPALRDLRFFLAQREPHELWFGILAIVLTGLLLIGFMIDSRGEEPVYRETITYVQSWPLSRTDREIIAQQKIDQVQRDKDDAAQRAREAKLRAQFKRMDDQMKAYGL